MPVPLPSESSTVLTPPAASEAALIARCIATAVAPAGGLTGTQRLLLRSTTRAMTGLDPDLDAPPLGAPGLAQALAGRNGAFRTRIVQMMLLDALVLRPLPDEVVERIRAAADELSVDDAMIAVARRFAAGQLGLAAMDFERNGYTASWTPEQSAVLHASQPLDAPWREAPADRELAQRWQALEGLPEGSLGLAVSRFYRARGFQYPGTTGSVSPLLAQHDWVHVLADYGATIENELEVFAFIARANDDPRGFSFLAMVVSLFETGYLASGAGLFESAPGYLDHEGMAERLADGLRRGALTSGSNDFLAVDWFELAPLPLDEVRRRFGVVPKSEAAVAAGSAGPFEPGGMTPYQWEAGHAEANRRGVDYQSWGAAP